MDGCEICWQPFRLELGRDSWVCLNGRRSGGVPMSDDVWLTSPVFSCISVWFLFDWVVAVREAAAQWPSTTKSSRPWTWSRATWCSPSARRWRCWRSESPSWWNASPASSRKTPYSDPPHPRYYYYYHYHYYYYCCCCCCCCCCFLHHFDEISAQPCWVYQIRFEKKEKIRMAS